MTHIDITTDGDTIRDSASFSVEAFAHKYEGRLETTERSTEPNTAIVGERKEISHHVLLSGIAAIETIDGRRELEIGDSFLGTRGARFNIHTGPFGARWRVTSVT